MDLRFLFNATSSPQSLALALAAAVAVFVAVRRALSRNAESRRCYTAWATQPQHVYQLYDGNTRNVAVPPTVMDRKFSSVSIHPCTRRHPLPVAPSRPLERRFSTSAAHTTTASTVATSLISYPRHRRGDVASRLRAADGGLEEGGELRIVDAFVGSYQLEEMEDDTTTLTALSLNGEGRVVFETTDGPLPISAGGSWGVQSDGTLRFDVTRQFEGAQGTTYSVTRTYLGTVEEETESYAVIAGEVFMGEWPVGYHKMLLLPTDVDDVDLNGRMFDVSGGDESA